MAKVELDVRTLREVRKRFGAGGYQAQLLIKSAVFRKDFVDALRYQVKGEIFAIIDETLVQMTKEARAIEKRSAKGKVRR